MSRIWLSVAVLSGSSEPPQPAARNARTMTMRISERRTTGTVSGTSDAKPTALEPSSEDRTRANAHWHRQRGEPSRKPCSGGVSHIQRLAPKSVRMLFSLTLPDRVSVDRAVGTTHHRSSPEVARMTERIDLESLVLDSALRRADAVRLPGPRLHEADHGRDVCRARSAGHRDVPARPAVLASPPAIRRCPSASAPSRCHRQPPRDH